MLDLVSSTRLFRYLLSLFLNYLSVLASMLMSPIIERNLDFFVRKVQVIKLLSMVELVRCLISGEVRVSFYRIWRIFYPRIIRPSRHHSEREIRNLQVFFQVSTLSLETRWSEKAKKEMEYKAVAIPYIK